MITGDFFKGQVLRIATGITLLVLFFPSPGMVQAETGLPDMFERPGLLEANGTQFELNNSEYLNITLISSEPVNLVLESIPKMVTLHLESIYGATSTQIILSGFVPQTTYHKYEDSYHNKVTFTTDDSGKYIYRQDLSKPHLIFIQPEISINPILHGTLINIMTNIPPGPYFINDNATGGDCALIGIWSAVNKTCTLTTDLTDTIEIDSGGITLNGNGYTIDGQGAGGIGIFPYYHSGDVTIKNLNIRNFSYGILQDLLVLGSSFISNNISYNGYGIGSFGSQGSIISENIISNNEVGICLCSSGVVGTILTNNDIFNNDEGIHFSQGHMTTVQNNKIHNNSKGFWSRNTNYNTFIDNDISNNTYGFYFAQDGSNIIEDNKISHNVYGIYNSGSVIVNSVNNNSICFNDYGIYQDNSYDIINNNIICNNLLGVYFSWIIGSQGNTLSSNKILNNEIGLSLEIDELGENTIYNNYFINKIINAQVNNNNFWNITRTSGTNIIGGPYIGGNFWGYPNGTGFSQTCSDADRDGICDSAYVLDSDNTDYLPLAAFSGPPGYGYISGTVLDNGTGIEGARVTANTSLSTTTYASGSYSFLVVAGTYNLTATREPVYYRNSSVVVTATSGTIVSQDIKLTRKLTGNITGNITRT